ncbi:MAG: SusC/RagA family TonB-linked outer membrane protein, partial [Chitinophagaceae bacterium]|nr:SusC/RagA family TonB-linked outer membrane protein [Chitinophagaceae bacterium]
FTSVDMGSQEVNVTSAPTLSVVMTTLTKSMDEVIVVAYGTVKKGDFTGSANQTSYDDFKNRPILNPLNALVATGPGVQTTAAGGSPGSSPGIRIRGFGSIGASDGPLYVVDNVAYDGGMANLNTEDIETITTLKDAATVALWGSRASNGVIMITTKRGKRNRSNMTFKVLQGVSTRGLPEYDRVDAFQYYPLMWEGLRNSLRYTTGQTLPNANTNATAGIKAQLGYNPFNVANNDIVRTDGTLNPNAQLLWANDLDWNDELERMGSRQEYNITYSGGNDKSDYFGSFGYTNEKGFIIRSDWRRFAGRLNMNTQPVKWFKTGLNISAVVNNSNQASDGSSTGYVNPFFFTRTIGPIYPVYAHNQTTGDFLLDANGSRFYDYGNFSAIGIPNRAPGASPGRHILEETKLNQNLFKRNTISGRAYGSVVFTPWLKFTTNISVDLTDFNSGTYENTKVGDGAPAGRASKNNQKTTSYTFNQLLDFDKTFGDHHVLALIGHENYDYNFNLLSGQRQGQVLEGNVEFPNFSVINSLASRVDNYRIESYFTRLNYDFRGKYFVSANIRADGNSRFESDVRWDNFWGVGVGWRLDKEKFMEGISWINALKLRSSYGQLGNDAVGTFFAYQALYALGFNNANAPGALQSQLANPKITWESSNPFDVGLDFGFLKNRIRGTIEYYNREISGLIFDIQTPLSNGGFVVPTNVGNMYNKGIELEIAGDIIRKRDFNWELKINASTVKNRITKMPDENKEVIDGTKKLMEKHSIYDYWLRDWYGVDPSDGVALFAANNGLAANTRLIPNSKGGVDSVTTDINNAKYHYAGTAIPKLFGGIENTVRYKAFEFSILVQYQLGGKVYDNTYAQLMHPGEYGTALHVDALTRWSKPGDITNMPRMQNSADGIYDAQSDRWLIDASFLNIRSITLSYQVPKSLVSRITAQEASVYIGAENVFLFSKRKGMNVNQAFTGVTSNVYTPARIITAGITLNF